jgi:hypothetical protein
VKIRRGPWNADLFRVRRFRKTGGSCCSATIYATSPSWEGSIPRDTD